MASESETFYRAHRNEPLKRSKWSSFRRAFVLPKASKKDIPRRIFAFKSTVGCEPDDHKEMPQHSKEIREEFLGPKNAKVFFWFLCKKSQKRFLCTEALAEGLFNGAHRNACKPESFPSRNERA